MEDITAGQLKERIAQGDSLELIDVREPYEHDEFNIGGRNLPLGDIQTWKEDIEDLKSSEVVLYCRSGNRSGMAKQFLSMHGFEHLRNLTGGILAWQEEQ